ncbi:MAG: magnesium transporter [Actinobacteria bacterium]|nr:MAG: magnesium transporter [Actinomycetota bacterium]
MLFFSDLQESKVMDSAGRFVGKLHDIGMGLQGNLPQSEFLVISRMRRGRREMVTIPWEWVSSLQSSQLKLDREREEVWQSEYSPAGILLGRNLLDRQIVDLYGNKVVRVNDLRLAEFDSVLRLTGVDVSQKALLRRLSLEKTVTRILRLVGGDLPEKTIPWDYVAPLEVQQPDLKLTVTASQLGELHPTDIADIIEQLDPYYRERLFDLLGALTAAESLSEVEPGKQADVIENLAETKVSNLLEIMPPDEATDILALLPRDKAERLLNIMGVREAGIIRELLGYGEDTAGGRMTPEFLSVPSSYTALDTLVYLRKNAPDAETLYYVYVKDNEDRLKGVVSLRDLLTSPQEERVEDFMYRDVISVNISEDQEAVADTMSRYNFLALPVVDDSNNIKGIITVDDMIDVIREEAIEDLSHLGGLELAETGAAPSLRTRLPSILITLLGGLAAALLVSAFEDRIVPLISLVFFIPLVLRAAQDISIVSQAVVLEEIGGKDPGWREILVLVWKEMRVVLIISLGLSILGGVVAALWEDYARFGITIGLTLFITVVLGTVVGICIPLVSRRIKGELRYTQARFSSLFIGITTLAIYLGISTALL